VWSPDGTTLAVASGRHGGIADRDQSVQLWDVLPGSKMGAELQHRDDIRAIAFSANGEWIGTGSEDYDAKIWNRRTGQMVGQPLRHHHWVVAAAFSPDGRIFATGSADGLLRLWQVPGGEAIGPAIRSGAEPKLLAFDDAGESVVVGFGTHYLRWDLALSPDMRANLAQRVTLASGMRLNGDGVLQPLPGVELVELLKARYKNHK
jgi:WD40 repeat protein